MRAVIYARYSSDQQRDSSIEDQLHQSRAFIERQGWTHLHAYADRALSGSTPFRPGYQQLLEDACNRGFEVIVAEALDRLSRDQADVASLFKHLRFLGIRLVTLAEGEITELHVGLKGMMNALFLRDLAQKTRRGLEGRVREGRSAGGLCYGYDVVRAVDDRGEAARGGRRINEAQAEVVRRIFKEFAAGTSPRAIARQLNVEGIPSPDGERWRDTTIRGHQSRGTGILNNELYVGRLVWNRQTYVKDPSTGKRLSRRNPESAWVIEEVPELRIVGQELWERAKARQREIAATPQVRKIKQSEFWKQRRPKHLLTGLCFCATCGSTLASIGRDYLGCSSARGTGSCSNRQLIRRGMLEELIVPALKERLMAPELVKEFVAAFNEEVNAVRRVQEQEQAAKQRELAEVSRRLDGLIEAIADGLRSPGLKTKLEELERRKAELEAAAERGSPALPRLHPNLAEMYRRKVEALHEALAEPATRDEALELLRSLIDRVELRPGETGLEIELTGAVAQMVAAATGTMKNAAAEAATACSVKVVAGAGFEPATFRL